MATKSSIRDQLLTVFPVEQADVLATVVVEAHDWLATKADVQDLRALVADLAEAQHETAATVRELATAQHETAAQVKDLTTAQREIAVQVKDLVEFQKETGVQIRELTEAQRGTFIRLDRADRRALEWNLRSRLPAYIGRHIKRCRVLDVQEVVESLEPLVVAGTLDDSDLDELRLTDIVASGTMNGEPIYLVCEASCTARIHDLERAVQRAAILTKGGKRAIPYVACENIRPETLEQAERMGVRILVGGRILPAAG